ncbi:ABC transporter substrate-binding protein [Lachnospiraceae bacterium ZAX-1]
MKRNFKRVLSMSLVCAMVFATLAGCGSSNSDGQPSTETDDQSTTTSDDSPQSEESSEQSDTSDGEAPVAVSEWEFPMLTILTGSVAFAGLPAEWGAQYAVKEINEQGGIRGVPVKLTVRDTAFDTAKAVQEMSAVVDDALIVFGPMDAPSTDAGGQVASEAKVPILAAATTESVREKYAPYAIAYMTDSEKGTADAAVKWATKENFQKIVMFYYPADNSSAAEYELTKSYLEKEGKEIVGAIEVTAGQLDLGPSVVKALGYEADAYFVCLRTEEFVRAVQELRNRGITEGRQIMGGFSSIAPNLFELADGSLEDVYIWNKIDPAYPSDKWNTFVEAYKADNDGQIPSTNTAANYYEAVMSVKEAFETLKITGDPKKRQEERDAIAEYLYNSKEYDYLQGKFQNVNGEKIASPHVFQIKDNDYVRID